LPELSADKPDVTVSFSIRMGTEWNDALYVNPGGLDRLSFAVVVSGDLNELWSSDEIEGSTGGQWERIELSLGPYAGQNVSLRFEFDSVDSVSNDFLGVQLDDIAVGQLCP
jgi:hypothetical protein